MFITIPKIVREKPGEEVAEGLVELLNYSSDQAQTSTIRWMLLFWVGQIGVMLGILILLLK